MNVQNVNIHYREASKMDLDSITQLHIDAFPNFFLTKMGYSFVMSYYQIVLNFPDRIALVAESKGIILGFIVGFGNPSSFYSFYKKHKLRLIPLIILSVLKNPLLIKQIIINVGRVSGFESSAHDIEISSIAVSPKKQDMKIGKNLLLKFLDVAREQSIYNNVFLTTDSYNNEIVNSFYQKQEFILKESFWRGNRKMNLYFKALS